MRQIEFSCFPKLVSRGKAPAYLEKESNEKSFEVGSLKSYQIIETKYGKLSLLCPNKITEFRARTFHEKEPETLEWIDSIGKEETLWDIGANVGLYSMYAAQKGLKVLAFEPSPANYHLLNSNIEKNCLYNSVSAYCLAFSEKTELGSFYMSSTEAGSALNSLGEPVDWQGRPYNPAMIQGMIAFSIDDFVKQVGSFESHAPVSSSNTRKIRGRNFTKREIIVDSHHR